MVQLKIVYVDDEPDLLEIFVDTFSKSNFDIKTFASTDEALDEIKINTPDLLILDYRLTNTTGYEFAKLVDPCIPKIMITGELLKDIPPNFIGIFPKPYDVLNMEEFLMSRFFQKAT
jgi:DNA-binding NtrC family response regulator